MPAPPNPRVARPPPPPPPPAQRAQLPQHTRAPPPPPKRVDLNSPAYKKAERKYTRLMIAMPILLVTSYVLFDRLALGHETKTLSGRPGVAAPAAERKEGNE